MDCDAFSDVWCAGSDGWTQTQSEQDENLELTWTDRTLIPFSSLIPTAGFFDENANYLHWNDSSSRTPAPLFPDDPFTFFEPVYPTTYLSLTVIRRVLVHG
jgi:hypothetical protein